MSTDILDPKVCGIKGCNLPSLALGLCNKHWRRMKRYGSPLATKNHVGRFYGLGPEERFWMQVKKADGCWLWIGGTDQDQYGAFRGEIHGVVYRRAHRYSWALHNGQSVPVYGQICHTCDNPRCVRPEHLYLGTGLDNMRDKIRKGRMRVPYGEQAGHAKITEKQAKAILRDPRPYAEIGANYNVAASTIGSIKQRLSWSHLDVEAVQGKRPSPRRGVSDKLTPDIVRAIRKSNEGGSALAKRYGVSPATVCDIRQRRSWKHID